MLGLGNALTRSINFGLVNSVQSLFDNAPTVGTYAYGGVVLAVEEYVGPEEGNAVIYVGYPSKIQYPDGGNPEKYFDTTDSDSSGNYIFQDLSSIQGGAVYEDWTPALKSELDKIVDYVKGSSSQAFFYNLYGGDFFVAYSGARLNETQYVYDPNTMFDGVYYSSGYLEEFRELPIRKEYVTLRYSSNIDTLSVSLKAAPPEALGAFDVGQNYDSSISNINQDSLSIKTYDTNYNVTAASSKNGVITFTVVGPSLGSDVSSYKSKKESLPVPWNNLSGEIYAVFYLKIDYYGNSQSNFFDLQYQFLNSNYGDYYTSDVYYNTDDFVGDYGTLGSQTGIQSGNILCYSKVKEVVNADIQNAPNLSGKIVDDTGATFPKSTVVELDGTSIGNAFVCYKFEFDVTIFPYLNLLNSLNNELGYSKYYIDKVSELYSEYGSSVGSVTIKDVHIDSIEGNYIPRSNWWLKAKAGMMRFVSDSYLPSDIIITPPNLQNIYVPIFPSDSVVFPNLGERFDSSSIFNISDYMDKVKATSISGVSEKSTLTAFVEYKYDSLSDLNNSTIHSSGDYAFVDTPPTQYLPASISNSGDDGLYVYNGASWSKSSTSNGQYINFSGTLYVYSSSTSAYSRFTDSDLFN